MEWSRLAKGASASADPTCSSNCQAGAGLYFSIKCYRDFPWERGDEYTAHGPKPVNSHPSVFAPAVMQEDGDDS